MACQPREGRRGGRVGRSGRDGHAPGIAGHRAEEMLNRDDTTVAKAALQSGADKGREAADRVRFAPYENSCGGGYAS